MIGMITDIIFKSNDWIIDIKQRPHWFWAFNSWFAWKYYHEL